MASTAQTDTPSTINHKPWNATSTSTSQRQPYQDHFTPKVYESFGDMVEDYYVIPEVKGSNMTKNQISVFGICIENELVVYEAVRRYDSFSGQWLWVAGDVI